MPLLTESNVRHLLRRTEVVDRPARVSELMGLGTIEAAVDNVMDVAANPPSASFESIPANEWWSQGVRLGEFWMDEMARARRPFGERMAFFWHGHLCSALDKVNSAGMMREQVDLYRRRGLGTSANGGSVGELVKTAATQVAMLRYLDNDQNFARSPNQNFARELMELFLLGVGNYTEADVEAATAAWTGHGTVRWDIDEYLWRDEKHDKNPQQFLGRTINQGTANQAGNEMIDVVLGLGTAGSGIVPVGANTGRQTNAVAAEFLTFKLWQEFGEAASGSVPGNVRAAMAAALTANGFAIRPWVRSMLTHDDFYTPATRTGLVRQPVEYAVALMVAVGLKAEQAAPHWRLDPAGQRPLYPPNVSGWKPNGYWVNASTMGARQGMVQNCLWALTGDQWWNGDNGVIQIGTDPSHRFKKIELEGRWQTKTDPIPDVDFVDRLSSYAGLQVSTDVRTKILGFLADDAVEPWMRLDAIHLLLTAPDMHIA